MKADEGREVAWIAGFIDAEEIPTLASSRQQASPIVYRHDANAFCAMREQHQADLFE